MRINGTSAGIADSLRVLWDSGALGLATDAQLLERFVASRDEAAFSLLVDRHGAMVWSACLAVLSDVHDAQDAWQATFLILFRRAGSIRRTMSVGPWLFGVARRVSLRARNESRRRQDLAIKLAAMTPLLADPPESWADLHEEIDRLPALERAAIIVCDLEGVSHEDAARRLSWPVRTVRKRLYRGRDRLRDRLTRRGLALAPIPASVLPLPQAAKAALARCGVVSPRVLSLAQGVSRVMMLTSWKTVTAGLLGVGILCGAGMWALARPDDPKKELRARPVHVAKVAFTTPSDADARLILRKAAEGAMALGKEPNGSWSLTQIASAQAEAGDRDGARATFRQAVADAMAKDKPNAWWLWRIGHFQVLAGEAADAKATLAKAADIAKALGPEPKDRAIEVLAVIIQEQRRIGDKDGTAATVAAMRIIQGKIDPKVDPFSHPTFVGALAAAGEVDDAFFMIEFMRNDATTRWNLPGSLGKIAEGAQFSDDATAKEIVRRVADELEKLAPKPNEQVFSYGDLAQAQARLGQIEAARRTALSIGRNADGSFDLVSDTQPYILLCVAVIQEGKGDRPGARQTMRLALQSIRENPNMRGVQGRLEQVGGYQAALGDVEGAREVVAMMEPGLKHKVLLAIAQHQKTAGAFAAAKTTTEEAKADAAIAVSSKPKALLDPQPQPGQIVEPEAADSQRRAFALADVARVQALDGDFDAAEQTIASIARLTKAPYLQSNLAHAQKQVAGARASIGDLSGALATALKIEAPDAKRKALEGVAAGYHAWKAATKKPNP
ncbi:MAG: sigE 22 [Planctomycetota bacterium]|nr:sigE 22 [Planctomycetota bacterium]